MLHPALTLPMQTDLISLNGELVWDLGQEKLGLGIKPNFSIEG